MTNEEVMQTLTNMGLHEGGMDNWVADNAWVKFADLVASAEREACVYRLLKMKRSNTHHQFGLLKLSTT